MTTEELRNLPPKERVEIAQEMVSVALFELTMAWVAVDRELRGDRGQ